MKRTTVFATTLAIAGSALFAAPVSADPVVTFKQSDAPVTSVDSGTSVTIEATGCTNPDSQTPPTVGMFLALSGDPSTHPEDAMNFGDLADENGSLTTESVIDENTPAGTWHMRWYCAADPVSSLDDASMLWVGPLSTMEIRQGAGVATNSAVRVSNTQSSVTVSTASARTAGDAGSTTSVIFHTDADDLPQVDKLDIVGSKAAALKAKVDANAPLIAKTEDFFRAFYGRTATDDELTLNVSRFRQGKSDMTVANSLASKADFSYTGNRTVATKEALATATSDEFRAANADENYVIATYRTVAGRIPTDAELAQHTAELKDGALKVQVIEDIALEVNTASYWNAAKIK
jgi:hypothetical protein